MLFEGSALSERVVEKDGGQLGVMSEGQSQGSGGGRGLERSLDQRGPNDGWGGRGGGWCYSLGSAGLDQLSALSHVPVVLHDSLDDLVLVEVQVPCTLMMLNFVLQN